MASDRIAEMQKFAESILTLQKSIGHIRNKMCSYYEKELDPLRNYISSQNKKAAQHDWWIEVTGFEVNIGTHGSVYVEILGKWNNGQEIDENLSNENYCQKTLDELSKKYKIRISYPYYYFGK